MESDASILPSHIKFVSGLYMFHVELYIEKIELGWDGEIDFVMPSGYKFQNLKW